MAHLLKLEQREHEFLGGMYEWKVKHVLEHIDDVNSPAFKIGRYHSFLRLRHQFLLVDGHESRILKVDLRIFDIYKLQNFYKYFEACLISYNGECCFNNKHYFPSVFMRNTFNVMSWKIDDMDKRFEHFTELLTEGPLIFRLAWSANSNSVSKIDTPLNQIKGKISTKSSEKLFKDLEAFYESKTNTDCILKVGDVEFPVHRGLLCSRSSVFAAMFRHNTSESQNGVVEISDVDSEILNDVLHYVYTGHIHGLTPETAVSMHATADKYELIEMRDDCLKFLKLNLTIENMVDAIKLAYLHEDSELEIKVIMFMQDNSEKIEENDKWKAFSRTDTLLALRYLHSALNDASKQLKKLRNEH